MYGVSLMFLKGLDLWEGDIDGDGDIDRDDVLAVTKDTARDIFKRHFWDRPRAGEMPPLVGVCFYDFAVNAGAATAPARWGGRHCRAEHADDCGVLQSARAGVPHALGA